MTRRDFLTKAAQVVGATVATALPTTTQDKDTIEIQPEQKDREERKNVLTFESFLQGLSPHDILYITEALEQDNSQGKERQTLTIDQFAEFGLKALERIGRNPYRTIYTNYFPRGIPEQELTEFQRTGLTSMDTTPQMCLAFLSYPYHPSCYAIATESVKQGFEIIGLPRRQWVRNTEILDPIEQAAALIVAGGEALSESVKAAMPPEAVTELEKSVCNFQTDEKYALSVAEAIVAENRTGARGIVYTRGLTTESNLHFIVREHLRETYGLRTAVLELMNIGVDVVSDETRRARKKYLDGRDPTTLRKMTAVSIAEGHHGLFLP